MIGTVHGLTAWAIAREITLPVSGVQAALEAATAQLEVATGRTLTADSADVTLTVEGDGSPTLLLPDMLSVTAIAIDNVTVPSTEYRLLPLNSTPKTQAIRKFGLTWYGPDLCTITVTGKRGYRDPVPVDLIDLAYALAVNGLSANAAQGLTQLKVGDTVFTFGDGATISYDHLQQAVKAHLKVSL